MNWSERSEFLGCAGPLLLELRLLLELDHAIAVHLQLAKPPESMVRIRSPEVPDDRLPADGHHRLWTDLGFPLEPRPEAASRDEDGVLSHC